MEDVFGAFTAFLVAALPLAVLVTKAVDTVRNLVGSVTVPKWVWNVLALGLGVLLCLGWGFNLFDALTKAIPALAESDALSGTLGSVLTGLAVGAMAGFWHEKMDEWSSIAKANKTSVPTGTQV
jgi:hypothetical protein